MKYTICFNKSENTNIEKFYYSATAGIIGSIITQPIDYVKTLQQLKLRSFTRYTLS